jgi:hypothetical protein
MKISQAIHFEKNIQGSQTATVANHRKGADG